MEYQINVGTRKMYTLSMRLCNESGTIIEFLLDGRKLVSRSLPSTKGQWATVTTSLMLTPGLHRLRLNNVKQAPNRMNWLRIEGTEDDSVEDPASAVFSPLAPETQSEALPCYDLSGRRITASPGRRITASPGRRIVIQGGKKVY